MTKNEFIRKFKNEVAGSDLTDKPRLRLIFHTMLDDYCRNGIITVKQYNEWEYPKWCE